MMSGGGKIAPPQDLGKKSILARVDTYFLDGNETGTTAKSYDQGHDLIFEKVMGNQSEKRETW